MTCDFSGLYHSSQFVIVSQSERNLLPLDIQERIRPCSTLLDPPISPQAVQWQSSFAYVFAHEEHININEARAALSVLQKRLQSPASFSSRYVHFLDSLVVTAALAKGRSSSRALNRVLRRICAYCIASGQVGLWLWVCSGLNPADIPSRLKLLANIS